MKNIIIAWIEKYLLRVKSPSGAVNGYEYEYDYIRDERGRRKAKRRARHDDCIHRILE